MTVDRNTGEIVEPLTEAEAERLTTRIALKLDAMADTYVGVMPMIREAIDREAFRALGYRSVGEYVADRFGGSLGKLGMEIRREVVRELTDAGMSTRAIAPVVGASHMTVQRDLESPVTPVTPATPTVAPREFERLREAGLPTRVPAPVVGIDGKTYTRPEPAPRSAPRRALPDQFFDAAYDAAKKVESLHRLISDDRFPQNAEKVAAKHRNDLLRTSDLLQQVINALTTEESTRA